MTTPIKNTELQRLCLADTLDLFEEYQAQQKDGPNDLDYVYLDRGSSVLAVVHLDTVQDYGRYERFLGKDGKTYIRDLESARYSEQHLTSKKRIKRAGVISMFTSTNVVKSISLDDRLGLYVIMNLLPQFNIYPDVLMTIDEEIGQSTAREFLPDKQYNWMFSFDRRGLYPVLYEYDTPELRQVLNAFNFKCTYGSFSDISDLTHLGCSGINFGVGYNYEHTHTCCASLETVYALVQKFVKFYDVMQDVPLPYTYVPRRYADWGNEWQRSPRADYGYDWDDDSTKGVTDGIPDSYADEGEVEEGIARAVFDTVGISDATFDRLGRPPCDFCGTDRATHIVPMDGDFYLCDNCYHGVRIAGNVPDDWDDNLSTRLM